MTTEPTELKPNVYLSDVAMRIAVEMEAQSAVRATTVEKAEAICDILSALEPQAVDDAMVERAIDAVMDADRYAPKIVTMGANPPLFDGMQIDHDGPWVSRVTVAKLLRAALQAAKEPSQHQPKTWGAWERAQQENERK